MADKPRRSTDPAKACMTIRLYRVEQVDRLINELRAARKLALHRGGCGSVFAHDHRQEGVRVHLEIDLTGDALRKHTDHIDKR